MSRLRRAIEALVGGRSGEPGRGERRHLWEPGGAPGFVHFDVPGDFGIAVASDGRLAARRGPPPGIAVRLLRRGEHDEWLDHLLEGAPGEEIGRKGEDLARRVAAAPACHQVRGSVADPESLRWLRDVEAIVDAALDAGGLAVRDEVSLRGFDPAAWRRDVSGSDAPVAIRHVAILVTPGAGDGDLVRTRGLAKVGRPDLVVRDVRTAQRREALEALNALAALSVAGARLPERGVLEVAGLPDVVEAGGLEDGALRVRLGRPLRHDAPP